MKQMLETDIAFYMGWLGHYAGDAAMPLHDSIHHDGWVGKNPKWLHARSQHSRTASRKISRTSSEPARPTCFGTYRRRRDI